MIGLLIKLILKRPLVSLLWKNFFPAFGYQEGSIADNSIGKTSQENER